MENEGYFCKECNMPVIIRDGEIIRACNHTGTIVLGMSAIATGESSTEIVQRKEL